MTTRDRFVRTVILPMVALAVAFGLGAIVGAHRDTTSPACTVVAPSAADGTIPAGWEFERADGSVGRWYATGDVLKGWARSEDSEVFTTRDCAVR